MIPIAHDMTVSLSAADRQSQTTNLSVASPFNRCRMNGNTNGLRHPRGRSVDRHPSQRTQRNPEDRLAARIRGLQLDTVFFILSIAVPPILAFMLQSKLLAIFLGTIWLWGLLVTASQYNLAYDPHYDSFAPAISIVAGWYPGLMYSSLCVIAVAIAKAIWKWTTRRRHSTFPANTGQPQSPASRDQLR